MFKAPYGLNFTTILDFLSVNENKNKQTNKQNWPLSRGYFGSLGRALVAVVEGLNTSQCMDFPPGQNKKCDCCREVAISGGSTVNGIMSLSNNYKRLFKKY